MVFFCAVLKWVLVSCKQNKSIFGSVYEELGVRTRHFETFTVLDDPDRKTFRSLSRGVVFFFACKREMGRFDECSNPHEQCQDVTHLSSSSLSVHRNLQPGVFLKVSALLSCFPSREPTACSARPTVELCAASVNNEFGGEGCWW